MTIARKHLVDPTSAGFYHCTNRCVRRTFLCGFDEASGRNYSHRKDWIENRILELAEIFSIEIFAYAVMSNHYHIVLYIDPNLPNTWSDDEIVEKWFRLYPSRLDLPQFANQRAMRKSAILNDEALLTVYRKRLGCLSWFMKRLNEPLAKQCNKEDYCTGRFWEDRFTSQALLDETAILSCMAYVDLNPVRARITEKLEESHHTSIKKRIDEVKDNSKTLNDKLIAVTQSSDKQLNIELGDYIALVEWTGQSIIHPGKASIPQYIQPILQRLNLQPNHYLNQIVQMEKCYSRAIGTLDKLKGQAEKFNAKFLKGFKAAKLLYQNE